MKAWVISGGQLLRDNALRNEDLFLGGGVVLPDPAAGAARLDAQGLLILPGIVDIHGDAHERQFQPRPGVSFPSALALRDSESQILAAGITTAFLGVTLSWEPGLRSVAAWRQILQALEATPFFGRLRGDLVVSLYNQKEVWPIFGYEGASYDKGGYIERGFNDIDWLPEA